MPQALESQSTQSFNDFLKQAQVSFAVSTYQAGKLILMRAGDENLNTHFIELEKPMGIALNGAQLSVGSGPRVINYYNMPAAAAKVEPFDHHDACFLPRSIHITGDIDIHEMSFDNDGALWCVNTKMSCLCTLTPEHSVVPRWKPPFITGYDLTDRCHLNGLAMKGGKATWVTAMGTTDTVGGWRDNKADGGVLMDVETGKMVCEGLSMPHSPRWHNDKLWVLESGAGTLLEIDPATGEKTVIVEMPGFCRGFDFVGKYAIVGLSEVRETAVFAGLPLTQRVAKRECGVYIIDTQARQIVAYMVFTGGVQETFAVQVIPDKYPAVLDVNDPLVSQSYSLPDEALTEVAEPDEAQIKMQRALALYQSGEKEKAASLWQQLLSEEANNAMVLYYLGITYSDLERWDEAITLLDRVVAEQADHAEAHNSLGHAWAGKLDEDKALRHYDLAIKSDQKYAVAHFNRGILLLKRGQYAAGWKGYEWRWQMPSFTEFSCPQPKWTGEDISDKVLLVHTEQGNGDAIQFARLLPSMAQRCKKLIVVCTQPLRTLFKGVQGVDEVRLPGTLPADLFDVYCPIMSLAGVMGVDENNLYADVPYFNLPVEVAVPVLTGNGKLKVGLAWSGSATHANDHHRSCALASLLSLTKHNEIDFFSFQIPLSSTDKSLLENQHVVDLEPELISYSHTAKLVTQCDLVISVCTSLVHLSGALNIPTWVLVSKNHDWRWLNSGETSGWYPSIKLYRQAALDDWDEVISRVNTDLSAL